MTDPARLDFDSYPTGLWFRNFPLHQLKGPFRVRDLDGTHFFRHTYLSRQRVPRQPLRQIDPKCSTCSRFFRD